MEIRAISKSVRISPRKVRIIADSIRNLSIEDALHQLQVLQKRAARPLSKTLQSAIANATNNAKLDKNNLVIGSILVSEGTALKRFMPSTRGRIHPYKKRSSNITIVLKSVDINTKAVTKAKTTKIVEEPEVKKKGGTKLKNEK